jgi:hypothetical protein
VKTVQGVEYSVTREADQVHITVSKDAERHVILRLDPESAGRLERQIRAARESV